MTTFHTPARRALVWRAATYAAGFALVLLVGIELIPVLLTMGMPGNAVQYWWDARTSKAYPLTWRDGVLAGFVIYLLARSVAAWRERKGTNG